MNRQYEVETPKIAKSHMTKCLNSLVTRNANENNYKMLLYNHEDEKN